MSIKLTALVLTLFLMAALIAAMPTGRDASALTDGTGRSARDRRGNVPANELTTLLLLQASILKGDQKDFKIEILNQRLDMYENNALSVAARKSLDRHSSTFAPDVYRALRLRIIHFLADRVGFTFDEMVDRMAQRRATEFLPFLFDLLNADGHSEKDMISLRDALVKHDVGELLSKFRIMASEPYRPLFDTNEVIEAIDRAHARSDSSSSRTKADDESQPDTAVLLPKTTPEAVSRLIGRMATGFKPNEHDYKIIVAGILQNRRQRASSADQTRLEIDLLRWMGGLGNAKEFNNLINVINWYSSRTNPASIEAVEKIYEAYVARFESIDVAIGAALDLKLVAIYRHVIDTLHSSEDHRPDYVRAFRAFVKKCKTYGQLDVLKSELSRLSPLVAVHAYDIIQPEFKSIVTSRYATISDLELIMEVYDGVGKRRKGGRECFDASARSTAA